MITFAELKNKISDTYSLYVLEGWLPLWWRRFFRQVFFFLFLFLLALLFLRLLPFANGSEYFKLLEENLFRVRGLMLVALSGWLFFWMLELFYFSMRAKETDVDFKVARLVHDSKTEDTVAEFILAKPGRITLMRCGINTAEATEFLKKRKQVLLDLNLEINVDRDGYVSFVDYGMALYNLDKEFADFLQMYGVTKQDFESALIWRQEESERNLAFESWWSRENLLRRKSLGRGWAFGSAYSLEHYGRYITEDDSYRSLSYDWELYVDDAKKIEGVLVKDREANVLIVSDTVKSGMSSVATFAKMIFRGKVPSRLESFKMFVLDGNAILDSFNDRADFENEFNKAIAQASRAGNIILVIPHIASFVENAMARGSNIALLLGQALDAIDLHVIGISDKASYHTVLEPNLEFKRHFEKLLLSEFDEERLIAYLRTKAEEIEARKKMIFTVQVLREISQDALRLFVADSGIDKSLDLLDEIAAYCEIKKKTIVTIKDAQIVISKKTGVPQGEIQKDEREKLSNLENVLHRRVVEQNSAIDAISNALRRARSGLGNPKKPLGSFLFLGPTGVGKTETAKALAEVFFGNENEILRLDMSEFSDAGALEKMIGSHRAGSSGILSSRMRDKPYGVLLLDEFEKTTDEVRNLFLQILDEGIFADGQGNKVTARNLIIIATSNAGSDLIYEATKAGKDLEAVREEITNDIIKRGIYRPELLNRFDGIIMFHPLSENSLRKVAELEIAKLAKRLKEKGIELVASQELIMYLAKVGLHPQFGARALNRAVQDEVESLIARKIVDGTIGAGAKISLKPDGANLIVEKR